jgi:signal transduction histidine kinase
MTTDQFTRADGLWNWTRSITFRFSSALLFVLAVVIVLGLYSAGRLSTYRTYSGELRDRFFRSTQYIGDLNNYTSDFRAAEATTFLAATPAEDRTSGAAVRELDGLVDRAEHSYEHFTHDANEWILYDAFKLRWAAYRQVADRGFSLWREGRKQEAIDLYETGSRGAYDAASDSLGALTDLNVADATEATQRADGAFRQARLLTIVAMGLAGVMVVGGLVYMRRVIADPLVGLARSMEDLARKETAVAIPGAGRRDEIGTMARAVEVFRLNAIELAMSQRALAAQAAMLAEQLADEQRLTQMQRNFLAMASHEFRTPLTIIDGHAQRLISARERLGPDDVAERAAKVRVAVQKVTRVIENLIETARLMDKDANWNFHPTALNVAEVLAEVCRQHREVTPDASIIERYETTPLTVFGDAGLLQIAFANLIANGVKYSVGEARLVVSARTTGTSVEVDVEDQGVGIPERDRGRLFDRYVRGSNVSAIVGTGVGLYLVKTVVELHGGAITVQSAEGKGSRFTVRLPSPAPG